ncbi:MAG: hypothetical protein F2520_11945 [Actinobacteria bacterium]|uniref:Unannotated protein n=1 Tax=freshwater metagenome TaxID=449393 RepID=A0A6J5YIT4_9ZZZZ|nr:hypothetical protein [Actinomycetota bacterium]MTA78961.1 hypothetical protein [Actinomycetota bacterium]
MSPHDRGPEEFEAARLAVLGQFADLALDRSSSWSLAEVCTKLCLDVDRVRTRAAALDR